LVAFDLLILDCDGVLVDSETLSHRVLVEMLEAAGVQITLDQAFDQFLGKSTAQSVEILGTMLPEPATAKRFMETYKQRLWRAFETELRPVAGIELALDRISIPSCVASSGEIEKMRLTLGRTGLLPRFERRLTSVTEVEHAKPAPDVYLLAARRAGVLPERCVVVEDSPTGVAAGVAAGMTVFGYSARTPASKLIAAGACQTLDDMLSLPSLIGRGAR
jgi:HAD superfamily hydrolase (TIGR01509 family)